MKVYTAKQITEMLQEQDFDINLRTVRYYTQIGIVPALELVGNKRVYTNKHLNYFRAILVLAKTGESLASIQKKLQPLDIEEIKKIGDQAAFFQSHNFLEHETHQVSEDVLITLSPKISAELKQRVINSVSQIIKGDQNK
ncbi:MerR family transcriptional regulator [Chengkuizengella sp. 2205SS18-9]|uniref:MerR family transcriptional regulator n=1 Tax=Chengkuizengella axinellae TaxID=3064388 RepID=A0ABT9IVZ4_9BACL|nr:MerR family transcriptional regulator [Chengkuizengella sp. 2205SS18-9]MDP5273533.1 MerR family transcriptional regulator [Chengkuizengella sp. 2205SS18-9]